jgi:hypothetical protein
MAKARRRSGPPAPIQPTGERAEGTIQGQSEERDQQDQSPSPGQERQDRERDEQREGDEG